MATTAPVEPDTKSIARDQLEVLERDFMRLNINYCACIDEDRLEDWPTLFLAEGRYLVQSRENLEAGLEGGYWMYYTSQAMMHDRVTALRHINTFNKHYYCHLVGNLRIVSETDGVFATRTNFFVTQTSHEGKTEVLFSGEYHDQIVYLDSVARFKEKLVLPNTFHTPTAIVSPL